MTLAEIAEQLCITRQGVSDALKKARTQLEDYEDKLGLAARYRGMCDQAERCLKALESVEAEGESLGRLNEAREALENILQER